MENYGIFWLVAGELVRSRSRCPLSLFLRKLRLVEPRLASRAGGTCATSNSLRLADGTCSPASKTPTTALMVCQHHPADESLLKYSTSMFRHETGRPKVRTSMTECCAEQEKLHASLGDSTKSLPLNSPEKVHE